MRYEYKPKNNLEKFGVQVYNLLVENFSQTFFVGGMVRDLLRGKKITDIDIATSALPDEVAKVLKTHRITFNDQNKKFGNVIASQGRHVIEITTFRKDLKANNRYPKVEFVKSPKEDSKRRDFTINALYLSHKTAIISDFHNGLKDLKNRQIKFIGNPEQRIKEDPLRILRALRFSVTLGFGLENKTAEAIKNNYDYINSLTQSKKLNEIDKVKNQKQKLLLKNILFNKIFLDKQLK